MRRISYPGEGQEDFATPRNRCGLEKRENRSDLPTGRRDAARLVAGFSDASPQVAAGRQTQSKGGWIGEGFRMNESVDPLSCRHSPCRGSGVQR